MLWCRLIRTCEFNEVKQSFMGFRSGPILVRTEQLRGAYRGLRLIEYSFKAGLMTRCETRTNCDVFVKDGWLTCASFTKWREMERKEAAESRQGMGREHLNLLMEGLLG